jgi:hypothetical protein
MTVWTPGYGATAEGDPLLVPAEPDALRPENDDRYGRGMIVALSRIPGLTGRNHLPRPLYFQCPPLEEMPRAYEWNWNDYPTLGVGTHSAPAYRQLPTVTFNSLFVDDTDIYRAGAKLHAGPHFAVAGLREGDILKYIAILRDLGDSMTPFALQYGQPNLWGRWDYLHAVSLRSFQTAERAGEIDARYFTVSFTEYPDAPRVRPAPPPAQPGARPGGRSVLATFNSSRLPYNLRTLALIAKRYYKAPARWRLIYQASHLSGVGPNTDLRKSKRAGRHKPPKKIIVPRKPS